MGSVNGGEWQPKKEEDKRFLGKPGEIKTTYHKGYKFETRIGKDGKADYERHNTDHGKPHQHTNPHDHPIDWSDGFPHPGSPINYPDGAPEFKLFSRSSIMEKNTTIFENCDDNFKTIAEFKWCMANGGELQFEWKGKEFCAFGALRKTEDSHIQMFIGPNCVTEEKFPGVYEELWCDTPDELLEYVIDGEKLRDIITQVNVFDRPFH